MKLQSGKWSVLYAVVLVTPDGTHHQTIVHTLGADIHD